MSGTGKYTIYAPLPPTMGIPGGRGNSDSNLLKKLFKSPAEISDQKAIVASGNKYLIPPVQAAGIGGNSDFPNGVHLDYHDPDPKLTAPDIPNIDVAALGVGGPSTPYTPNLSSPDPSGGGSTAPIPAVVLDPKEINPGAQVGVDGTVDPATAAQDLFDGIKLGTNLVLGVKPGTSK